MQTENNIMFTKEMAKNYTILLPDMLPIHLELMESLLKKFGYKVVLLRTTHQNVIEEGLKYVHNDMCYPALLVIGQFIDALKSGKFNINKCAIMITQTGGGCRASNYLSLIRKALKKAGFEHIPVISFNFSGLEKSPGFKLSVSNYLEILNALLYGDLIMGLKNQVEPYELKKKNTEKIVKKWLKILNCQKRLKYKKNIIKAIILDFKNIKVKSKKIPKVGIVGEIYVKYSPLGNNNLENFLLNENVEIYSPPVLDFAIYCIDAKITEKRMYNKKTLAIYAFQIAYILFNNLKRKTIKYIKKYSEFIPPCTFKYLKEVSKDVISNAVNMGEGWLLTAEMCEMAETGIDNIICTQPFGCLPNHIIAKGMISKIKSKYHNANIVAIDYDPGASKTNQENRIKLMLQIAKDKNKKGK